MFIFLSELSLDDFTLAQSDAASRLEIRLLKPHEAEAALHALHTSAWRRQVWFHFRGNKWHKSRLESF